MSTKSIKYLPKNSLESARFEGVKTFMRLPHGKDLNGADVAIFGVPFDSCVSYRPGTRFAPSAIREESSILKPYCPITDVDIIKHISILDYGDISTVPGYIEDSFSRITSAMIEIVKSQTIPVAMGGDHSVSLPLLRGLTQQRKEPVALLHFDAHSDTIPEYFGHKYNHGTPFYWALEEGLIMPEHSIQVGIRGPLYSKDILNYAKGKGVDIIMGHEVHEIGLYETIKRIRKRIAGCPVYITFDIDFLDAAYCPGTGTPEVGGFTTWEAQKLLHDSAIGMDLVGMDCVEVLPMSDCSGITALAGASLIHMFLAVLAKGKETQ